VKEHTKNQYTRKQYNANVASETDDPVEAAVEFWGDSLDVLRGFPKDARYNLGYAIRQLQRGQTPMDRKPMPGVGPGVFELRDQDERSWYRVIHLKKTKNVIHILHCFEKQTNQTEQKDIDTATQRLSQVLAKQREEARSAKRQRVPKDKRQRS
jgi:phage-related protein